MILCGESEGGYGEGEVSILGFPLGRTWGGEQKRPGGTKQYRNATISGGG